MGNQSQVSQVNLLFVVYGTLVVLWHDLSSSCSKDASLNCANEKFIAQSRRVRHWYSFGMPHTD